MIGINSRNEKIEKTKRNFGTTHQPCFQGTFLNAAKKKKISKNIIGITRPQVTVDGDQAHSPTLHGRI